MLLFERFHPYKRIFICVGEDNYMIADSSLKDMHCGKTDKRMCNLHKDLEVEHVPIQIPSTTKKKYTTKRCLICLSNGKRRESRYQCSSCVDSPALCRNICFSEYHRQRNNIHSVDSSLTI